MAGYRKCHAGTRQEKLFLVVSYQPKNMVQKHGNCLPEPHSRLLGTLLPVFLSYSLFMAPLGKDTSEVAKKFMM